MYERGKIEISQRTVLL